MSKARQFQILDAALDANKACVADFGDKKDLALPPAICDARLDPAKYAGLGEGDAYVIRNAMKQRALLLFRRIFDVCVSPPVWPNAQHKQEKPQRSACPGGQRFRNATRAFSGTGSTGIPDPHAAGPCCSLMLGVFCVSTPTNCVVARR